MQFRLGTFSEAGSAPFAGIVLGERVIALERLGPLLQRLNVRLRGEESVLSLLSCWEPNFAALKQIAAALAGEHTIAAASVGDLKVHAPINVPRQTFCTIANYRSHIADGIASTDAAERLALAEQAVAERLRGTPYVCFKLPSAIAGPTDPLEIPYHAERLDWELELGVVIGRACRRAGRHDAMKYVAGYVLVNDITLRERVLRHDLKMLGSDWLESKNAPGFLPMGPYFVPADFVPDPYVLRLTLSLNGQVMQDELVSDMVFDIASQIEYISQHAQLLPGDVICTGTPGGCGTRHQRFLKPGDVIEAAAPGLGVQRTPCVAEQMRRDVSV